MRTQIKFSFVDLNLQVNPSSAGPTLSAPANAPGAINEGASLSSAVIA